MGYIDKALEKAKAAREKGGDRPAPALPKIPLTETPVTTPPLTTQIRYSATRTVPLRAEILQQHRVLMDDLGSPVAEEYKILRTQILQRTKAERKNALMITGPSAGEGKTLTAINLAISLVQEVDKSVLLVDADLRHPNLAETFGLPKGPGLVDYLSGKQTIPELLVHPQGFDKLVLLPAGRSVPGAPELISSPVMADLVGELKEFYHDRYIIFDLPPVLPFADALAFAPLVDGIVLVVEMGRTSREEVEKCLQILKDYPILGFVLNKVETPEEDSYYSYGRRTAKQKEKKGLLRWVKF